MSIQFKGCPKCRGDLSIDEGDWLCFQCGTYYYTNFINRYLREGDTGESPQESTRAFRSRRSLLTADQKWARSNAKVIGYIKEGLTTQQIIELTGRGKNNILKIRERLGQMTWKLS